jgi:hypothetical protein
MEGPLRTSGSISMLIPTDIANTLPSLPIETCFERVLRSIGPDCTRYDVRILPTKQIGQYTNAYRPKDREIRSMEDAF